MLHPLAAADFVRLASDRVRVLFVLSGPADACDRWAKWLRERLPEAVVEFCPRSPAFSPSRSSRSALVEEYDLAFSVFCGGGYLPRKFLWLSCNAQVKVAAGLGEQLHWLAMGASGPLPAAIARRVLQRRPGEPAYGRGGSVVAARRLAQGLAWPPLCALRSGLLAGASLLSMLGRTLVHGLGVGARLGVLLLTLIPAAVVVASAAVPLLLLDLPARVARLFGIKRPPVEAEQPPPSLDCTVIIPCRGGADLLREGLPALLVEVEATPGAHEVIVVDDAGPEDLAGFLREHFPSVRCLTLPRNLGFAGAVGEAIKASDKPLFVLLNSDMVVQPGFLRALLAPFADRRVFGVCSEIRMAGGQRLETGVTRGVFDGLLHLDHDAPSTLRPILYAGGGSSAYHRAKWEHLGGLDRAYKPFYWEDVDLGFRAWRQGWLSLHQPRAAALHRHRATIGAFYSRRAVDRIFQANSIYFCWKNLRSWSLLARHFAYLVLWLASSLRKSDTLPAAALVSILPRVPRAVWERFRLQHQGGPSDLEVLRLAQAPYTPRQR